MSAGIFTDEEIIANDDYDGYFKDIYGPKPVGKVSDHWKANSPLYLLDSVDPKKLISIRYYIDCGDDDFLFVVHFVTLSIRLYNYRLIKEVN